ncbi:hypothetical protein OIU84_014026 [Salix udensis]|uniref:Uncharacterized protein n=1 Tax=Salix udensis TaxID=889485 RepID=A0AAD6JC30_9ROSI|nr:hypothetical protein OIU84_014026 [Salix udensis]
MADTEHSSSDETSVDSIRERKQVRNQSLNSLRMRRHL